MKLTDTFDDDDDMVGTPTAPLGTECLTRSLYVPFPKSPLALFNYYRRENEPHYKMNKENLSPRITVVIDN
jgi:hypothetical protein